MVAGPRELVWVGDSLESLKRFPPLVRKKLGFAMYQAQIGQQHENAKILRGFEETVWQVKADDRVGPHRAVYVVQFKEAVYALHAFQKSRSPEVRRREQS